MLKKKIPPRSGVASASDRREGREGAGARRAPDRPEALAAASHLTAPQDLERRID